MEILQGVDLGTILVVGVGCVLLCVVGIVLIFGLQIITTVFTSIFGFFELFTNVLAGGPVAWCGCALLLVACFVCAGLAIFVASVVPNCSTPDAVNFCRFLGY